MSETTTTQRGRIGERPLVVGSAGQVGAALVQALGSRAIATKRNPDDSGSPVLDMAAAAHDNTAATALLEHVKPTSVFCVGGATDVERCESDLAWAMDTNCEGPAELARLCRGVPFVFFSTDYVFNGHDGPYDEDAPTDPLSVYGRSKLLGEQAVLAAHPEALVVRTNVVYGPDRQGKNFLYTLRRLLNAGTTMRIPTDQYSTPTYNPDLAQATLQLADGGHTGLFNVSGAEFLSRWEFAQLASRILGLDATFLQPVTTPELKQKADRPLRGGLNIAKLQAALPKLKLHTNEGAIRAWKEATAS